MPRKFVFTALQLKELYDDKALFAAFIDASLEQPDATILHLMAAAKASLKQLKLFFPKGVPQVRFLINEETGEFTAVSSDGAKPPKQPAPPQ